MRSPWKGPFIDPRLNRDSLISKPPYGDKKRRQPVMIHTHLRGTSIPSFLADHRVAVHTGNTYRSFVCRKFMVGHRFGEFIVSKKLGRIIHLKKKKKKKKGKK